ncbi:MogA/MoaB family molybdenum cofactor biosynthesis protein [Methanofollis fontis]|uniref:Molybdenum cofactor biosynthesis protein n=1 Tax=Methanofollis fontis TaxID=2052832 RepID=A0A483CRT7_9EURY|nr:MogA/MoaB family molybdenum cofactor biosynthesis protein [Methanofollis fontis]TAJ45863.1 molybdenum cofactor biosynthesis protein [Methanofollis fontis]
MKTEHIRDISIGVAVITVSTTRTEETDTSGRTIREHLEGAGYPVRFYRIVKDDQVAIRAALICSLSDADAVILNGGTGLTSDDCTIEAVEPFYEKRIDGFGEIFRRLSYEEIGTSALLSRASAGVAGGRAIFCIPGSTGAVRLAMADIIIPELRHILSHARG